MADLGHRTGTGFLATAQFPNLVTAGGWVIRFPPEQLPADMQFEMWHGSVRGPGGFFMVYMDDIRFGIGSNGTINEYAPRGSAMLVKKGQTIFFFWSIATGAAPTATIFLREPEVGRI